MERIDWLEFRDWVPTRIATVLLPLGTLEPHGVAPNGTDILAPRAIAREIAPRVNAMIAPVTCSGKSQNRSRQPAGCLYSCSGTRVACKSQPTRLPLLCVASAVTP